MGHRSHHTLSILVPMSSFPYRLRIISWYTVTLRRISMPLFLIYSYPFPISLPLLLIMHLSLFTATYTAMPNYSLQHSYFIALIMLLVTCIYCICIRDYIPIRNLMMSVPLFPNAFFAYLCSMCLEHSRIP